MSELAQRTPAQALVARVREDEFKQQVKMALPPTVTVDKFIRIVTAALLANPDIAKLDHNSVLRAMVQSAAAGLIPDGKEAAIVGRGGNAVFQPMIGGFRRIAAEHGWDLKTRAVYTNDDFAYTEEPESVRHTPCRPDLDRGDLIGAYAKATHKDGRVKYRVMFEADIAKRRAQATTQNVWSKWPAEMYEKTAGRDLFADLPLAESDLERERIARILDSSELRDDPAAVMYGRRRDELPVIPAPPAPDAQPAAELQQVDAATREAAPAVAASAPGPEVDEEPEVGAAAVATPGDEALTVEAAASVASTFEIPNGKNRGKTLAEVHASGEDGAGWLGWALKNIGWPSPKNEAEQQFRDAIWAFCRHHERSLYEAAYAAKQSEGLL